MLFIRCAWLNKIRIQKNSRNLSGSSIYHSYTDLFERQKYIRRRIRQDIDICHVAIKIDLGHPAGTFDPQMPNIIQIVLLGQCSSFQFPEPLFFTITVKLRFQWEGMFTGNPNLDFFFICKYFCEPNSSNKKITKR